MTTILDEYLKNEHDKYVDDLAKSKHKHITDIWNEREKQKTQKEQRKRQHNEVTQRIVRM